MRSQRHKRPRHRVITPWPDGGPNPDVVAANARYVGSPQGTYKAYPLEEVEFPKDPEKLLQTGAT